MRVVPFAGGGQRFVPIVGLEVAAPDPGQGDQGGLLVDVERIDQRFDLVIGLVVAMGRQDLAEPVVACVRSGVIVERVFLRVDLARLEDDETDGLQIDVERVDHVPRSQRLPKMV